MNDYDDKIKASPAARRRARELGVDISTLTGSGIDGRIQLSDVEDFCAEGEKKAEDATITEIISDIPHEEKKELRGDIKNEPVIAGCDIYADTIDQALREEEQEETQNSPEEPVHAQGYCIKMFEGEKEAETQVEKDSDISDAVSFNSEESEKNEGEMKVEQFRYDPGVFGIYDEQKQPEAKSLDDELEENIIEKIERKRREFGEETVFSEEEELAKQETSPEAVATEPIAEETEKEDEEEAVPEEDENKAFASYDAFCAYREAQKTSEEEKSEDDENGDEDEDDEECSCGCHHHHHDDEEEDDDDDEDEDGEEDDDDEEDEECSCGCHHHHHHDDDDEDDDDDDDDDDDENCEPLRIDFEVDEEPLRAEFEKQGILFEQGLIDAVVKAFALAIYDADETYDGLMNYVKITREDIEVRTVTNSLEAAVGEIVYNEPYDYEDVFINVWDMKDFGFTAMARPDKDSVNVFVMRKDGKIIINTVSDEYIVDIMTCSIMMDDFRRNLEKPSSALSRREYPVVDEYDDEYDEEFEEEPEE